MADDPEQVFAAATAAIGAPPIRREEMAAVLRLAKVMADASERRFAPLTCYAAGLAIGAAGDEDRLAKLQEFIRLVQG